MSQSRFNLTIHLDPRNITPKELIELGQLGERHLAQFRISPSRYLEYVNLNHIQVEQIQNQLPFPTTTSLSGVNYVVFTCLGLSGCKKSQEPMLPILDQLHRMLEQFTLPGKTKIALSACPSNCSGGFVQDLGIFATDANQWTVIIGGNSAKTPRLGTVVAETLSTEQLFSIVQDLFSSYQKKGAPRERLFHLVERLGTTWLSQQ